MLGLNRLSIFILIDLGFFLLGCSDLFLRWFLGRSDLLSLCWSCFYNFLCWCNISYSILFRSFSNWCLNLFGWLFNSSSLYLSRLFNLCFFYLCFFNLNWLFNFSCLGLWCLLHLCFFLLRCFLSWCLCLCCWQLSCSFILFAIIDSCWLLFNFSWFVNLRFNFWLFDWSFNFLLLDLDGLSFLSNWLNYVIFLLRFNSGILSCCFLLLCNDWLLFSSGWLLCGCFHWSALFLLWWLLSGLNCFWLLLWLCWSFLLLRLGLILFAISCLLNGCGLSLDTSISGGWFFNLGGLLYLGWWLGCLYGFGGSLDHFFGLCDLNLFFFGGLGSIGFWSLILGRCTLGNLSFWLCLGSWLNLFRDCCLLLGLWLFSGRWYYRSKLKNFRPGKSFSDGDVLCWS